MRNDKIKSNDIIPLRLINTCRSLYPKCYEELQDLHDSLHIEKDDRCYLPTSYFETYAMNENKKLKFNGEITTNVMFRDKVLHETWLLQATASWRKEKIIYEFEQNFFLELCSKAVVSEIPVEILQRLPFNSFYVANKWFVKNAISSLEVISIKGFFVLFDDDRDYYNNSEIKIILVCEDDNLMTLTVPLIKGVSIERALIRTFNRDFKRIENSNMINAFLEVLKHRELYVELTQRILSAILYLCTDNSDIQREGVAGSVIKTKSVSSIKDKPNEIKKWQVGFKYKKFYSSVESNTSNSKTNGIGKKKRPHIRAGHFHHFWTKNESGERELKLRWVSATYINGTEDDIIPTITKVKDKK